MNATPPSDAAGFRDRSRGLVVYGWLLVVSGALCILAVLLMTALLLVSPTPTAAAAGGGTLAFNAILYTAIGAGLITLGAGSIGARRWARSLALVVAWCWLLFGAAMMLMLAAILPQTLAASAMPPVAMTCALAFVFLFVAVFFLAFPLLLALFYRRDDVRRTVEWRDPRPSWTDSMTPSVLGIVIALVVAGVAGLATIPMARALPVAGYVVTGASARLIVVAISALLLVLGWGVWRRSWLAWQGLVLLQLLSLVHLFTLRRLDMAAYMKAAGYPSDPRMTALQAEIFGSDLFLIAMVLVWLAMTVFLWKVRGQFRPAPRGQNP